MTELRAAKEPEYREVMIEPNFWEDLAVLINHRLISYPIVKDSLGWVVAYRWELWKPTIVQLRDETGESTMYEHFQGLATRIRKELRTPEGWNGFMGE